MRDIRNRLRLAIPALLLALALAAAAPALAAENNDPQRFDSAESAVEALARAVAGKDRAALNKIFGARAEALLGPADDLAAPAEFEAFDRAFNESHELMTTGDYQTLLLGHDRWPLPIPLARDGDRWYFDAEAGLDELALRRIGRNELDAMEVCLAYFDAQRDYYQLNPEGSAVRHYARSLISQPGRKDGLFWETHQEGDPVSPLGELMALAALQPEAGRLNQPRPYHGYYYKILTGQGPNAPGGAWNYLEDGQMVGGFGLVAYPAEYGVSGIMSFMINQSGRICQKDLGPGGGDQAAWLDVFDPDSTWTWLDENQESPTQEAAGS